MGFFDKLNDFLFTEVEEEVPTNELNESPIETNVITDEVKMITGNLWQYELALNAVSNLLSAVLADADWNTYDSRKKKIKEDVFYTLNYSPNKRQTASEFWRLVAQKLIFNQECLVVELSDRQLYVADTFDYKNGDELAMKQNTFVNVTVGNVTMTNKAFKEGDSAFLLKLPLCGRTKSAMASMQQDYNNLKDVVLKGAYKAMGTKYNLDMSAVKLGNKLDQKFIDNTTKGYISAMEKPNSVFITFNGEKLNDMTAQQRGSEVEQVLKVVENNVNLNNEILNNVARAYGIPVSFITMEITTDAEDAKQTFMTMFVKPILAMISERLTLFYLEKEKILSGAKIEADLQSINFVDVLTKASSMDKLVSSGMYTINELRLKVGDDTVEGGDTRFITKNYATLASYMKGGNDSET